MPTAFAWTRSRSKGCAHCPHSLGWVPSPHSSPSPATAQQQRQNDQMAVRALQTGLNASYQAAMNTANHLRY